MIRERGYLSIDHALGLEFRSFESPAAGMWA